MGITKHNWLIKDVNDIPRVVAAALPRRHHGTAAGAGADRPAQGHFERHHGVVLADVRRGSRPARATTPVTFGDPTLRVGRVGVDLPGPAPRPLCRRRGAQDLEAAEALPEGAGRPHRHSGRPRSSARGALLPPRTPWSLGHARHARPLHPRFTALQKSDHPDRPRRARFQRPGHREDQRLARPEAKIIHVDITDPAELGKVRIPDVGHRRRLPDQVIEEMLLAMDAYGDDHAPAGAGPRTLVEADPTSGVSASRSGMQPDVEGGAIKPPERGRAAAWSSDVGRTPASSWPAWASTKCGPRSTGSSRHPYTWVNSGGAGTMGFAVPAAIGAKAMTGPDRVGHRRRRLLPNDRAELVTASSEQIPVKIAIVNNGYLGMVRQWQEMFYEALFKGLFSHPTCPTTSNGPRSHGVRGDQGQGDPRTWGPAIEKANSIDDRPGRRGLPPTPGRRCTRWWPPARPTTTSSSTPDQLKAAAQ